MPRNPLTFDDVLEIGLKLPDVDASTTYGAPALKVRKSLLVCTAINKSAEPGSLMVRIGAADRDRLLNERPDVYYLTDHYAPYPCIVVRLAKMRRDELKELLGTAWRFVVERTPERMKKNKRVAKR